MEGMTDPNAPLPPQPHGPPPAVPPRPASVTGAGQVALVAAAVLGSLLLLTGVGLVAAHVFGDGPGRGGDERVMMADRDGPGNGKGLALGHEKNKNKGGAPGMGQGPQQGQGQGQGPGQGRGNGQGRLGAGVDDVLHGEFTTNVTGTPTVMVVQSGQVTAYTAGESLTVRSADGYEATYVVDATVATVRGAADLAAGVQVQVVAAKEGMKLTRLSVE